MPSTATRLATPQETRDFGYSCLDHIPHTSLADSHSQMACVTLPTCHWQIGQAGSSTIFFLKRLELERSKYQKC
ncbi:hypothetical protein I3760_05G099100 [Carya illinoinensis]|uniref:Uncharacterized protein n=1 Tax=Carya illinoinensis TaxID=32201 RepID=A0A8T1R960_CARIL|nr:hypothetical protein I3760_05G099100 [Carya illinoinensis]KAG6663666.1 hypothetical protein CIPAW_02G039800 [Carya illinoinensis]KAG6663668.1 hypothetical protein CIPAW_02G039800 [Carya illinoinensis]